MGQEQLPSARAPVRLASPGGLRVFIALPGLLNQHSQGGGERPYWFLNSFSQGGSPAGTGGPRASAAR